MPYAVLPRPDGFGANIRKVSVSDRLPGNRILVRDDEGYEHTIHARQMFPETELARIPITIGDAVIVTLEASV
jgi:hypothetical protein